MNISMVERTDLPVMYQQSENGIATAYLAVEAIEAKLPTLKSRKCFGVFFPETGEYRSCVSILPDEDPAQLELPVWMLPGGKYARTKIKDWDQKVSRAGEVIGQAINEMTTQINIDSTRPFIEFYQSHTELHLLLPVKD